MNGERHIIERRKAYPALPLVAMPIGSEMGAIILSAIERHGRLPVGVIGTFDLCYAAQSAKELFALDIEAFCLDRRDAKDVNRCLQQAQEANRKILVCGAGIEQYIDKKNNDFIVYNIGLSRESVQEALIWAKGEMVSRKYARERTAQFQMLITMAHEGIITTDSEGKITAINHEAIKLLKVPGPSVVRVNLWSILPNASLPEAFISSYSARATIQYQGEMISIRLGRVLISGKSTGAIVTFQHMP